MAAPKAKKAVEIFREQFRVEELQRLKSTDTAVNEAELSQMASKKWRGMSEEEKSRFVKMAAEEKETATEKKGSKGKGKGGRTKTEAGKENKKETKPKKVKDPNAPKKPIYSFFFFSNEQRSVLKTQNPEMSPTAISKELGRQWKELDAQEKKKYEEMAKLDKDRYTKENEVYQNQKKCNASGSSSSGVEADDGEDSDDKSD